MASDEAFWYSVGYALERLKRNPDGDNPFLAGLAERAQRSNPRRLAEKAAELPWPGSERLIAAAVAGGLGPVLAAWKPRRGTSPSGVLRAGVAGAVAVFVLEVTRPLLRDRPEWPELDRAMVERVLIGLSDGLVYGAVVEPRLPGPAPLKGALFGLLEHAVAPLGGVARLAGSLSPQRRIPFLGRVLGGRKSVERDLLDTVVEAVLMAVLYGATDESRGMFGDDELA